MRISLNLDKVFNVLINVKEIGFEAIHNNRGEVRDFET